MAILSLIKDFKHFIKAKDAFSNEAELKSVFKTVFNNCCGN